MDEGEAEWKNVTGTAGKYCTCCHNEAKQSISGVAVRYPAYNDKVKNLTNIEQRINPCRTENMQAPVLCWESNELLGLTEPSPGGMVQVAHLMLRRWLRWPEADLNAQIAAMNPPVLTDDYAPVDRLMANFVLRPDEALR